MEMSEDLAVRCVLACNGQDFLGRTLVINNAETLAESRLTDRSGTASVDVLIRQISYLQDPASRVSPRVLIPERRVDMSWLDQLGGMLQQYANSGQATQTTEQDFDNAANVAPRDSNVTGSCGSFPLGSDTRHLPTCSGSCLRIRAAHSARVFSTHCFLLPDRRLMSGALQSGGGIGSLGGLLGPERSVSAGSGEQIPPAGR